MAGGSLYEDDDGGVITEINVTPLVDVMLVLVVIFMVTAKLIVGRGIEVDKPKAAAGGEVHSTLRIVVDKEGVLFVNGDRYPDRVQAIARVREITKTMADPKALIAGDQAAAYGGVMRAIDVVQGAGITKIALENQPLPVEGGGAPSGGAPAGGTPLTMARSYSGWAAAATLAMHTLLAVGIDAAGVLGGGGTPPTPPPRIELVDIQVPPPPPPAPPAPPPPPEAAPAPTPPPPTRTPKAPPAVRTPSPPQAAETPPPPDMPTSNEPVDPNAGGADVVTLPGVVPAARGVPVARGARTGGRVGQGGTGTGTGAGTGSGSAVGVQPVSVAAIKKKAMPKDDYSYFDAGKDYPADARRLGIEGTIRVRLVVDASGKVTQRTLLNKLGHGLDELALKRTATFEFEPALDTNDRPVASVVVWTLSFAIPE